MPAVSQAQRGYLAATKGVAWMRKHHFDNKGKLPEHVPSKKKRKRVTKRDRTLAAAIRAMAAKK